MRNNSEIIDYMNKIREQKHMSISELARKTNVAKSSVSLYFNKTRKFPLNRLAAFANELGTSPEKILNVTPTNVDRVVKVPLIGSITYDSTITTKPNIDSYQEKHLLIFQIPIAFFCNVKTILWNLPFLIMHWS